MVGGIIARLRGNEPISRHISYIKNIRKDLDPLLDDEEKISLTNVIKNRIQSEAGEAIDDNDGNGIINVATRVGKSKIAINKIRKLYDVNADSKVLIVVPTERLRDVGWMIEFAKWGETLIYKRIELVCYASAPNIKGRRYDLVVLDEYHNITWENYNLFVNNSISQVLCLSATSPRDTAKQFILREKLKLKEIFTLSLDDAVALGIITPYDIVIVDMELDDKNRYIKAGRKDNPFYVTEKGQYEYLSRLVFNKERKMAEINRMKAIHGFQTKTNAAIGILENVIPKEARTIIFTGTKKQATELCNRTYYSKVSIAKKDRDNPDKMASYEYLLSRYEGDVALNEFIDGRINRIACVDALNEGHTIKNIDYALVTGADSNSLNLIQRMGRLLEYRPGHIGKVILLRYKNTQEEIWVNKALAGFDKEKIKEVTLQQLKEGITVFNHTLVD